MEKGGGEVSELTIVGIAFALIVGLGKAASP